MQPSHITIAPMLDWTDRHCRYFHRQLTQHATLYTEMITTGAIIHGDAERFLHFNHEEQPVVLQLGGSNPSELAHCAMLAEKYGYNGINLNVGCPSDRVQNGQFGACLMAKPTLVADCVDAMQQACNIPISVKTRIGIDDQDDYAFLVDFVQHLDKVGCQSVIIHARKAWLSGLSPKQNREIPPLHYDRVHQLKKDFPNIQIFTNGGIKTYEDIDRELHHIDGVMIGREAYQNPYFLAEIDQRYFGASHSPTRAEVIERMKPYVEAELKAGTRLHSITRHMLGLFNGLPGAKHWRRTLSEQAHRGDAGLEVLAFAASEARPAGTD